MSEQNNDKAGQYTVRDENGNTTTYDKDGNIVSFSLAELNKLFRQIGL